MKKQHASSFQAGPHPPEVFGDRFPGMVSVKKQQVEGRSILGEVSGGSTDDLKFVTPHFVAKVATKYGFELRRTSFLFIKDPAFLISACVKRIDRGNSSPRPESAG